MLFQSWQYLLLLISALAAVLLIKNVLLKKIIILALSIFFYAYGAQWQTLLFLAVIAGAYLSALLVEKNKNKLRLGLLIAVLFLPLLLYKYVPFVIEQLSPEAATAYEEIFLLPIGISFYTFQAVGYVIDVYRGNTKAERNILDVACFISFFPQLVAGPIERCSNIIEQLRTPQKPDYEQMAAGFRHIVLGLCLKLLLAETMAGFVDPVYNTLEGKGGLGVLIATFCFGIQIYSDFNGYTQIAIGSAKLLGVDLMENFRHPYRAKSISDFWRRWHISLTSWFRDYLYIPLGGNRKGAVRTTLNSIVTFLASGIWHGANWTYALWGLANGVSTALEKRYLKKVSKNKVIAGGYGVLAFILVNLFWVFFRANTIQDAFLCYKLIFTDTVPQLLSLGSADAIMNFLLRENGWSNANLLPMIFSLGIYVWYEYGIGRGRTLEKALFSEKAYARWITYAFLILVTLYFGRTLSQSDFVYFRF